MVYLGQETHFRRSHRVIFREEELKLECTSCRAQQSASRTAKLFVSSCTFSAFTFVRRLLRSQDNHIEIPQIFLRRRCAYSRSFESNRQAVSLPGTFIRTVCVAFVVLKEVSVFRSPRLASRSSQPTWFAQQTLRLLQSRTFTLVQQNSYNHVDVHLVHHSIRLGRIGRRTRGCFHLVAFSPTLTMRLGKLLA